MWYKKYYWTIRHKKKKYCHYYKAISHFLTACYEMHKVVHHKKKKKNKKKTNKKKKCITHVTSNVHNRRMRVLYHPIKYIGTQNRECDQ